MGGRKFNGSLSLLLHKSTKRVLTCTIVPSAHPERDTYADLIFIQSKCLLTEGGGARKLLASSLLSAPNLKYATMVDTPQLISVSFLQCRWNFF